MRFNKQEYLAKLRDPRWQKKRLEVLQRDEWTCTFCGDKERTLNVHHIWYANDGRDPWEYELNAFMTLCEGCHADETARLQDSAYNLVQRLKTCGAVSFHLDDLSDCFEPFNIQDAPMDAWGVITYGIHEIVLAAYRNSEFYEALRARFYADPEGGAFRHSRTCE